MECLEKLDSRYKNRLFEDVENLCFSKVGHTLRPLRKKSCTGVKNISFVALMAENQKLKNPPIKETILAVSFSESVEFSQLEKFAQNPNIATLFPRVNKGYEAEIKIEGTKSPKSEFRSEGLLLIGNAGENRHLHIRRGQMSFHAIKEYCEFEQFLEQFIVIWDEFQVTVGEKAVTSLSVRYLNEIERKDGEALTEVLKIYPIHPFQVERKYNSLINLRFKCRENPEVHANVVTATIERDQNQYVVLDIILTKKFRTAPNKSKLKEIAQELRELKNGIFFECITETTRNRYN